MSEPEWTKAKGVLVGVLPDELPEVLLGRARGREAEMPEDWQELQRLYNRFDGPMAGAVLKARWELLERNDQMSWEIRRASSTGLAYMHHELMHVFAAIEAAGYEIVPTAALSASPAEEGTDG